MLDALKTLFENLFSIRRAELCCEQEERRK